MQTGLIAFEIVNVNAVAAADHPKVLIRGPAYTLHA